MTLGTVLPEIQRRLSLWAELKEGVGPQGVPPSLVRDLGLYKGYRGIWVDKANTSTFTQDGTGITLELAAHW